MIMLNLRGQTGNNMFQYAAGKTYADRKGYRFCFRSRFDALFKRKKTGRLYRYFELDGETRWQLAFRRGIYALTPGKKARLYRNRVKQYTASKTDEIYDTRFYSIADGSTLQGAFQSERYFNGNRDNVIKWFTPRKQYRQLIAQLDRRIPVLPEQRCCIHIRRSDYIRMQERPDGVGWELPVAYYRQALQRLPKDLFYLIISDSPAFAAQVFEHLPHKLIPENNPAVVDMFCFTLCKYNVTANSTFSWWGAWLNQTRDKVVMAPEYHLGWTQGLWFPDGIEVEGWDYIDVAAALEQQGEAQ